MKHARFALVGALAAACSSAEVQRTELVVAVHADSGLAAQLVRVRARSYALDAEDGAKPSADLDFALGPKGAEFPFSFSLTKGTKNALLLVVEGFTAGAKPALVEQKVTASFEPRAVGLVKVFLSSACAGAACDSLDQTCDASQRGSCGAVPVASVARYDSAPELRADELDPPSDPAPWLSCRAEGQRDCDDDGVPRSCTDGIWARQAACGTGELCSAGECVPEGALCSETCTAACRAAGACTDVNPCAAGTLCAHGTCSPAGTGYACSCAAEDGYTPSEDAQRCVDLHECDAPAQTVCQGTGGNSLKSFGYQYPCEELAPYYRCTGQLAEYAWRVLASNFRFFSRTYVDRRPALTYDRDSANNVVYDAITGLEWEEKLTNQDDITWEDAMKLCPTVRTAGGGFRAPSLVELLGLVDDSGESKATQANNNESVAYDEARFPGPHDAWYWARDSRANGSADAYLVTQINGVSGIYSEKRGERDRPGSDPYLMRIRCVRPAPGL